MDRLESKVPSFIMRFTLQFLELCDNSKAVDKGETQRTRCLRHYQFMARNAAYKNNEPNSTGKYRQDQETFENPQTHREVKPIM